MSASSMPMKSVCTRPRALTPMFMALTRAPMLYLVLLSFLMKLMNGLSAAYLLTMSSVPSVEPSLTITQQDGRRDCPKTDDIVIPIVDSSFFAGVTRE